ncbi:helix-turn-helix domain-containing protein [Cellvibrio sp. NN19]|uniref:helix-turn-helix domain-containing protein n=1 Tax=Cellvibrio chitinivorans TaxID=3102792 RepID=UPI002B402014|nr:helix-turn-helix domain-containing protein [Cellvibrio sp. NN19]
MSHDATGIDTSPNLSTSPHESADAACAVDTAVRLKLIRDVFGFSQRELAKRAGVTNSSISMIEQGQVSPSIQSLSRILAVFPISLTDFFGFDLVNQVDSSPLKGADFEAEGSDSYSSRQLSTCVERLSAGQFTVFCFSVVDTAGVIIDGSVSLTLLTGNRLLQQGDHFYIPAHQLFRFINLSERDASLFRCSLFMHKG